MNKDKKLNNLKKSTETTESNEKNKINKINKNKIITLDISPHNIDKKYYSDYMIDFKEKYEETYKNIKDIKLKIDKFNIKPKITESNNELIIIIGNQTKKIELEEGYYELEDLINGISENLEDVNIKCMIDKKGRVIIENINNDDFEIKCNESSFGYILGFTEETYINSSRYISEISSPLSKEEVYLYFSNISTKPFCKISENKKITYLYKFTKPINELDCLIIQLKDSNTEEEIDFHNFYGEEYSLNIVMDCDKN